MCAVTASDDEGYVVETVLDGNKLGLSVYSINADVENGGSVVALDASKNSLLTFLLSQGNLVPSLMTSLLSSPNAFLLSIECPELVNSPASETAFCGSSLFLRMKG
jgi:hypothetical protein